jgi:ABC-type nitrate/sulfonate/bicarbonate transport system permease component
MAHLEDARKTSARELVATRLKGGPRRETWLAALIVVGILAAWEGLARAGRLSALFFPAPSAIALTLIRLLTGGELAIHLGATLSRLLLGFALGALPGLLLGLVMGWSARLRAIVDPFVAAAHPIPKIAILPLVMIVLGIGESSRVAVIAITAFFPMLINTVAGVRQIPPIYFEVARNYGAGRRRTLVRVILPGSLPLVLAGARLALNVSLLLTITVELVTAREGLGELIWFAWETLRTEQLYASLVVIATLGIAFNLFIQFLLARLVPWQAAQEA